jgi:hypothetical protein
MADALDSQSLKSGMDEERTLMKQVFKLYGVANNKAPLSLVPEPFGGNLV